MLNKDGIQLVQHKRQIYVAFLNANPTNTNTFLGVYGSTNLSWNEGKNQTPSPLLINNLNACNIESSQKGGTGLNEVRLPTTKNSTFGGKPLPRSVEFCWRCETEAVLIPNNTPDSSDLYQTFEWFTFVCFDNRNKPRPDDNAWNSLWWWRIQSWWSQTFPYNADRPMMPVERWRPNVTVKAGFQRVKSERSPLNQW